ncbi:MAG: SDR family oxidoreductase [Acetobacteraceae bacterium]|nr:SDR family oxidoreductase [Acetobacteraceae bacterium]
MSGAPVTIVSGGSRGLGAALVAEWLGMGHRVATFSRSESETLAQLRAAPETAGRLHWQALDARDPQALRDFAGEVAARFGQVDLLVNNAGIAVEGVLPTMREQDVEDAVALNLTATILLTQACARVMLRRRRGCIVNISSVNAVRGHPGVSVYSATKGALDAFTRSLAREFGPHGIRVNAVAPGYFESEMVASLPQAEKDRIARRTPLGRLAEVQDVVRAVRFLASDDASFITGQMLVVDGGITC